MPSLKSPFLMVAVALIASLGSLTVRAAEPAPARSEKATKLLKERLEILLEVLDATKKSFKEGKKTAEEMLEAQMAVYSAMLDMSNTKEERMKVYAQMLEELKKAEAFLKAQVQAGKIDELAAKKLHRLREIDIELSIEAEKSDK